MAAEAPSAALGAPASQQRTFIADLHLDGVEDRRFARFTECLSAEARWAHEIFILGDLFEAWLGDDDQGELAERACTALRGASTSAKVYFMPGNRDFLCGAGFAQRSGATIIADPFLTDDNLVLGHGDALCTNDEAYQRLRGQVRTPRWQKDILARPLKERRELAGGLRRASDAGKANKAEAIMDVAADAVDGLLKNSKARILIHGHTHRPGVHRTAGNIRYVLGDWMHCGWLLRQTGRVLQLECFSLAAPYAQCAGRRPPLHSGGDR